MGQCIGKSCSSRQRCDSVDSISASRLASEQAPPALTERLRLLGLDIPHLILEALADVRTLRDNDQQPPSSLAKLNLVAENAEGWVMVVKHLVQYMPFSEPMAPLVISLFFDESPLPCRDTVVKAINQQLADPYVDLQPFGWHRSLCLVIKCIAEKLADETKLMICKRLEESGGYATLLKYEKYADSDVLPKRQLGFCARWALDNLFVPNGRAFSYQSVDTSGINAMLNPRDATDYLKISPDGLEARNDASSFESFRATFQANSGIWYYEAVIITAGVMQIGWASADCKFSNLDGYGVGDDQNSVSYDGFRKLIWHDCASISQHVGTWEPGDVLGCLMDIDGQAVSFYLNGLNTGLIFRDIFKTCKSGFYAAASFMTCQQCRFNFGSEPFKFPPSGVCFQAFNNNCQLSPELRLILPRQKKMELMNKETIREGCCILCCDRPGTVLLVSCKHGNFCDTCVRMLKVCPFCRCVVAQSSSL